MPKVLFKKFAKYAHLMPKDVKIWEKFIDANPRFFSEVEYDVKVGEGRNYSLFPEGPIRSDMEYLSKKRIDVVGFSGRDVYIIELKPKAGMSAIGQVLSLAELARDIFPSTSQILPAIITDEEIPDTRNLCSKMGVLFLIA